MPLIQVGYADEVREGSFIAGAVTNFNWNGDTPVMVGNSDIAMRSLKHGGRFVYKSHHGLCISEREYNGRDDSDFYMTIWDEEAQAPYEYMFATTRGWSYDRMGASPDATPEVMAAYEAWFRRQQDQARARDVLRARIETARTVEHAHKGAAVRVVRGRKVKKGTEGKVLGVSERPAYMRGTETVALIDTGRSFETVLVDYLEVIAPSPEALQAAFDAAC